MTSHGNAYYKGMGMSPYDDFRGDSKGQEDHVMSGWKMSKRTAGMSKNSVAYQFKNYVPHAVYLYGKESSNGDRSDNDRNYRSARNHYPVHRKGKPVASRPHQLSASKWNRFKEDMKNKMKQGIQNGK